METRVAAIAGKLASISGYHQHSGTRDWLFGAQVSAVRAAVSGGHFWQCGNFSIQSRSIGNVLGQHWMMKRHQ